tara:strand:- start:2213 stop:5554 length:3342 start_codon:yes stop_codon:yes gene_type:complete
MANTIKLKRGSGSNPGTSDLSVGEVALRTDNATLFTKNDAGNIAEIGASSGVVDGDKGDITVSSSGATWTIDAGAIDNANINSSAAIAGSKISPNFGSQTITAGSATFGSTSLGDTTINSLAPTLNFDDSNSTPDYRIINNSGSFEFQDKTNSFAARIKINSDGHVDVAGNLDVGAGIDVTGNISVTGTVDGVDIAARDGTAARKDGSNMGATTFRVDGADFIVKDDTDSTTNYIWRDHSHDTLYLGTANAVVTPRSSVIPSADSTYNIGSSSTRFANIYGDNIFGDGSNLTSLPAGQLTGTVAAARLDTATTQSAGNNSTKIATTAYTDTAISNLVDSSPGALNTLNELAAALGDDANFSTTVTNSIATKLPLAGGTMSGAINLNSNNITNGGTISGTFSGSGASLTNVNATTLDSIDSGSFLRSDANDTASGKISFTSSSDYPVNINGSDDGKIMLQGSSNPYIRFRESTTNKAYIQWSSSGYINIANQESGETLRIKDGASGLKWIVGSTEHTVWNASNDGAGSGLDADTLDGIEGGSFLRSNADDSFSGKLTSTYGNDEKIVLSNSNNPYIRFQEGSTDKAYIQWHTDGYLRIVNQEDSSIFIFRDNPIFSQDNGSSYLTIWHSGNDGSGSGLDADLLDGQEGSYYRNASNINAGTIAAARVATLNQDTTGNAASADTVDIAGNGTDNSYSVIFSTNGAAAGRSLAIDSSSSQFVYNPSSNVLTVGSVTGNLTGLASSASILHISRTIAGTSFNGSANIDISYNNLTNKPTIPTNNNQLTNGAGYITSANGGNAATLDSIDSSQFVRSDTGDTLTGDYNTSGKWLIGGTYSNNPYNSVSSTRLLFGGGNDQDNYFIGTNLENYGGNYTKLDLRWHTGIRMGAQSGYGGIRFYNNEDLSTVLFSVSKGDANTRIESGELYHNTSGTSDVYWHVSNDGSGSGLDADTLDGVQAGGFLRADTADTASADITFGGGAGAVNIAAGSDIRFIDTTNSAWTGNPGTNAKIQGHSGYLYLVGGQNGIVFREDGTDRWYLDGSGHITPASNNTYDIGKSSHRVKNIYTNDLHLSNEGGSNSVDGTWGDWTLQEGDENIFMINNRTGKKYRMGLVEVT